MESVIEQLRVQDGKIFQNEMVLTLYSDVKRLVLDNILLALSTKSLDTLLAWEPSLEEHMVRSLTCHNPEELLNAIVIHHANLLYENRPQLKRVRLGTLLKGLFVRLANDSSVKTNQIQLLDPIKQDFVCREAFRRTLASDCMQFETVNEVQQAILDVQNVQPLQVTDAESSPQVPQVPEVPQLVETPQPVAPVLQMPTVRDRDTQSTISVRPKQLPDIVSIREEVTADDSISQVVRDNKTVLSTTSTMTGRIHRPTNFRRVILDDEKTVLTRN